MPTGPSNSIPTPGTAPSGVTRKPRTLVLCFDGTASEYSSNITNVIKLYSLLRKNNAEEQLCYYQAGIGTYFAPGVVLPIFRWAASTLDEAFAWYLYQHVIDGYTFLMENYNCGDRVCLFGFSRGAYTARALAGMLYKVGLLSKTNTEQRPFAYTLYKSTRPSDEALARGFKETFCRPVPIEFVGVWDTVESVGVITGRSLPFVDVNTTIRVFRQALSLDEHRVKYRPNLYHVPGRSSKIPVSKEGTQTGPGADEIYETDVSEVWFAGCHADVGGDNDVPHPLAIIPLRWMVEQIVQSNIHILFDYDAFARWNIPTNIGQEGGGKSTGNDAVAALDAEDAVKPIIDSLRTKPWWWILEILPTFYTDQNAQNKRIPIIRPHFGRGRQLPPDPLFHLTVKIRMDDLGYKPRGRYVEGTETYVS